MPAQATAAGSASASLAAQSSLAAGFYAAQALLAAIAIRDVIQIWQQLNLRDVRSSWPALRTALAALIRDRYGMSVTQAAQYYGQARWAAGVRGVAPVVIPDTMPEPLITATLDSTGSTATRERVSQELPRHRWAHLSCHGDQALAQPLQGGLLLYDGMISFDDLIARRHHGEYAFLSACKTATGGLSLADEAITIASALHYTGYRHVIATSWTVPDSKASELANSVYAFLTPDGVFSPGRTALALHHAVRSLRDAYSATPSVWMSFTHTGP